MDKFSAIKRINEYLGEEVCNEYNTYCKLSLVEDKGWRFDVLVRKFAKTDIYLLLRYWDGGIICMKIPQRRFGDPRRAFKSIWEDYVEIWIGEEGENFLKVVNSGPVRDMSHFVIAEIGPES